MAATFDSGTIHNGPGGFFQVRISGTVANSLAGVDDSGDLAYGYEVHIWQMTTVPPSPGSAPGTGSSVKSWTGYALAANNPMPFNLEQELSAQNCDCYFGIVVNAVGGGTVTLAELNLVVEAY